jgi:hypothetical protein
MAIAFDNAANTHSGANVASLTTAAWTIAGSDRILMGGIFSGAGTPVDPTSMKWGGSTGTDLTKRGATVDIGLFCKLSQYSLVAPTAGSNTLYGSWGSNQDETAIGGPSYTGVDQTTPHGTQASATGSATDPTATVDVTSASGELVVDVAAGQAFLGGIGMTAGASQVARVEIDDVGAAGVECFGMSEEAGAATVTMSWAMVGTTMDWGIIGIPLKPATGGGAASVFKVDQMLMLGVS